MDGFSRFFLSQRIQFFNFNFNYKNIYESKNISIKIGKGMLSYIYAFKVLFFT